MASVSVKDRNLTPCLEGRGGRLALCEYPIDVLGQLVSIGTLAAFLVVCSGVMYLRRTRPELERPFRIPHVWFVAPLGIFCSLALMLTLPPDTWIRLGVWLAIGLVIFFLYARRHTEERFEQLGEAQGT